MPQIKVTLNIGYSNARREDVLDISEDEWNACLNKDQQEELMNEYWQDWSNNYIDGGAELID